MSCIFRVLNSVYFFMSHGLWLSPKNFKHLQFVNPDKTLLNYSLLLTSLMNQLETYNVAVSLYWYIAFDKWFAKIQPTCNGSIRSLLLGSLIFSCKLLDFNILQLILFINSIDIKKHCTLVRNKRIKWQNHIHYTSTHIQVFDKM